MATLEKSKQHLGDLPFPVLLLWNHSYWKVHFFVCSYIFLHFVKFYCSGSHLATSRRLNKVTRYCFNCLLLSYCHCFTCYWGFCLEIRPFCPCFYAGNIASVIGCPSGAPFIILSWDLYCHYRLLKLLKLLSFKRFVEFEA